MTRFSPDPRSLHSPAGHGPIIQVQIWVWIWTWVCQVQDQTLDSLTTTWTPPSIPGAQRQLTLWPCLARPPEDLIVSDESNEEDKIGIKMDSGGEQFLRHFRHDMANTHYATKTAKAQLPSLKIKIQGL